MAMTPTKLNAKIERIKNNKNYTKQEKKEFIQRVLDKDAASLEPGNILAVVQASVFGMALMYLLVCVKYSLIPLLLL